jgi:Predicted xylanase/chitin deacetylase
MNKCMKTMIVFLLVFTCLPLSVSAAEGNWGLSYGEPQEQPTGNASAEELLENNAYFVDTGEEKVVYLTFDAGFENGYMEQILDVLAETGVPAAFFLVGTYIRDNPELVQRMVGEGHIVGNHTMNHPDMSAIASREAFVNELSQTEELYFNLTGQEMPMYYRPPQGKYSESNLQLAKELGYTTVFWSLAYVDWYVDNQPTKEQAFDKLIPRVHSGAIILLHSTSKTNANILKDLIIEYKAMGYEFRGLEELGQ